MSCVQGRTYYRQTMFPDSGKGESGGQSRPRPITALLVDRNFGPWFFGNLLSNSGNWLYTVTAAIVIFQLTGSTLLVGLATAAQFGMSALLSPVAGSWSDRIDRKTLLFIGQAIASVSAILIAVVAVLFGVDGLPGAWPVIVASAGIGAGVAVSGPPLQSLVPSLVPDVDLENAVALTSLTFNLGRAVGPATGGLVFATSGAELAFVINAGSFLALLVALMVIRPRRIQRDSGADSSIRAGLRYVWAHRRAVVLLAGIGAVGFASDPANTLTPALADELGGGDQLVAFLVSAFGIGATAAAFISGRLQLQARPSSVVTLGCVLLTFGLLVASVATVLAISYAAFFVMGLGFLLSVSSLTAGLHRVASDAMRGRVMSLWIVAFLANRPLASLLSGAISDVSGVRVAFAPAIVVALVGVGLGLSLRRSE